MEIPPKGWGAVEILIWDLTNSLIKAGNNVLIVNTSDRNSIINQVNDFNPDFIHIHYDEYFDIEPYIKCNNIAITSHYGYIEYPQFYDPGYWRILQGFRTLKRASIFALSLGIANVYKSLGFPESRISVVPNGVNYHQFNKTFNPKYPERSLCLGKIEPRKMQAYYQDIPNLYFAGPIVDHQFHNMDQYLGPFSKEDLYTNLTEYANLVLVSNGEAHPLVCAEALSAGLGLVVSRQAASNLDDTKKFITVIEPENLLDKSYISAKIIENRLISLDSRQEILDYARDNFDWDNIVSKYYLPSIVKTINENKNSNSSL